LPTGCKKERYGENKTIYKYKDWKCIKTKNNFVSDLRKDRSSNFPVIYRCYMKSKEMIGASERLVVIIHTP